LPPGIHLIRDPLIFVNNISLDSFFIKIGPERWVTVPDGYDGICVNRGKIRILEGGKQHHLSHVFKYLILNKRLVKSSQRWCLKLCKQIIFQVTFLIT
jgi:hypothetical protein